ncbi:hypothetical protein [Pseudonocardia kongjuensis]|uniref:hypothetical protein n=1 Tax=Pseudonocardia kongjuensis TaxID=102227 RepID=UPI0031DC2877
MSAGQPGSAGQFGQAGHHGSPAPAGMQPEAPGPGAPDGRHPHAGPVAPRPRSPAFSGGVPRPVDPPTGTEQAAAEQEWAGYTDTRAGQAGGAHPAAGPAGYPDAGPGRGQAGSAHPAAGPIGNGQPAAGYAGTSTSGPAGTADPTADPPAHPGADPTAQPAAAPPAPEASGSADRPRRRARREAAGADADEGASWLQQEIARRVADRAGGSGTAAGSGRHARVEPAAERSGAEMAEVAEVAEVAEPAALPGAAPDGGATGTDPGSGGPAPAGPATDGPAPDGPAPDSSAPGGSATDGPAPDGPAPGGPATDGSVTDRPVTDGPAADEDHREPQHPRARAAHPRPRSTMVPDPYAPAGLRDSAAEGVWPPSRPTDSGKQWPPVTGAAGLPRRIPGATSEWSHGWAPDRSALLGVAGAAPADAGPADTDPDTAAEEHPETRPVPTRWTAAGRRSSEVAAEPAGTAAPADPGLPVDDDLPDDPDLHPDLDPDLRLDPDPDDELRGPAAERTEVIWRAPGLDAPVAPAPAPDPGADLAATSFAPYTGARPRRFAAAPTDAPEPDGTGTDDGPGGNRVRIVLSERRSTAHSSRGLSDVQDPGAVGTLLRNSLVRTQLLLALRVSLVALFTLGMLPALFMALPVLGEIEVVGIRLPWLLLGLLVYPFLLGLGWWYVRSAESVEQDFADDVADR